MKHRFSEEQIVLILVKAEETEGLIRDGNSLYEIRFPKAPVVFVPAVAAKRQGITVLFETISRFIVEAEAKTQSNRSNLEVRIE